MPKANSVLNPTSSDWIALANSGQTFMLSVLSAGMEVLIHYAASKPAASVMHGILINNNRPYGDQSPTEASWIRVRSSDPNASAIVAVVKE